MREGWRRWERRLLEPVDAASVGVFRIVLGAMVAVDALRYLFSHRIDEYFIRPQLHFTYLYLDFVKPWPGQWMYVHFWALFALALLVGAGLFYRAAAVGLFCAYAYFFLLEQSIYMNHYYLILLLCLLLIWIPAHRAFALDRLRAGGREPVVPFAAVFVLRFQLFVTYFYGALAKLNADWLRAEPMHSVLASGDPQVPAIAEHFPPALLAYGIAYGGLLADLAIPLLLAFRRTVWLGFAYACVFHILNAIFLNIGIFSYLAVGAITIFFPPDWPRRLLSRWRRVPVDAPLRTLPAAELSRLGAKTGARRQTGRRAAVLLLACLHLYALFQLAFPLRHLLYPGPVSWTEEGHRFAWHMKLRRKESLVAIRATDPQTGRRWTIDPRADLRPRQLRKLGTFPDILLQYVHHHRDRLRRQGVAEPIITVDWVCSLNGRPYQRLVDPATNLATVERSWRHATWILPLGDGGSAAARSGRGPRLEPPSLPADLIAVSDQ
jgi:vitamin K-dependent gamma-carboxylase